MAPPKGVKLILLHGGLHLETQFKKSWKSVSGMTQQDLKEKRKKCNETSENQWNKHIIYL